MGGMVTGIKTAKKEREMAEKNRAIGMIQGGIEEEWEEMGRIKGSIGEVKGNNKGRSRKERWNEKCREEKKKVRKELKD